MIARDRELLVRLSQTNRRLGEAVVELMSRQDGGELPAEGLRALADVLGGLSADLYARASELDGHVLASPQHLVINPDQPHD
ncbi:hypothetical protein ACFS2C_06650 [Prauserella oleivorans]|uniref:Histidine kinase n=1 Tax=Prauserella oleivorans TaxID=1478153 RepID=A0ABW5W5I6_9PSEU